MIGDLLNIPPNWVDIKLGDIIELAYGKSLPKEKRNTDGKYPVYGSNGIVGYHNQCLITGPAIIVGRKGAAGIPTYSKEDCWPIDTTYFIQPKSIYDLQFVYYLVQHLRLDQFDRSTAIPGLNRDDAYTLKIGLPPLNEQKRIVAKIEELFSELDKGIESLKTAREQLKVYRQAVLKAAFEGRLTEKWREENNEKVTYSEQLLGSAKIKYEEDERLKTLPQGWKWVLLEAVAHAIDPQPSHRTPPEVNNGIPYVGVGDVNRKTGTFNFSEARKVSQEVLEDHIKRYKICDGDFIIGKIGTIGKPFKIPSDRFYALSANVVLVKPIAQLIDNEFLYNLCLSSLIESQFKEGARATTQAAFGIKKVRTLLIPFCPLVEQKEIVSLLSSQLEIIQYNENEIENTLQRVEIMRQAILKKAFSGKLVPQDPNDESASVLLERIRAEKEGQSGRKNSSRNGERPGKPTPLSGLVRVADDTNESGPTTLGRLEIRSEMATQLQFDQLG